MKRLTKNSEIVIGEASSAVCVSRLSESFIAEPLLDRRAQRASVAVERAGREREPQSGPELDEGLHGWPFCGDGEDVSEAREAIVPMYRDEAGKTRRSKEKTQSVCR